MNLSRRKLLLGAAAVAVAPALPAQWHPNPIVGVDLARGPDETVLYYGGARGGGKVRSDPAEIQRWLRECERIIGEQSGLTGQFRLVYTGDPWRD